MHMWSPSTGVLPPNPIKPWDARRMGFLPPTRSASARLWHWRAWPSSCGTADCGVLTRKKICLPAHVNLDL